MLQITAELSSLSRAQREAVASFVLTFPQTTEVDEDEEDTLIPSFTTSDEPTAEEVFATNGPQLVGSENDRLDKSGLPWDERIHAGSRVKTADGLWRKRRGIDDATVAQVEGELKALMAIPVAAVPSVPAPPEAVPPPIASVPPPPAPTVDGKTAFVELITLASGAIGAKTLTQEQLTAAVVAAGVPSLPLLGNRLDLVPQVRETIEAYIAAAS